MKELIEFINALNWQFVALILVLCAALFAFAVLRVIRRHERDDHEEKIERMRIDAARAIVPVQPRDQY